MTPESKCISHTRNNEPISLRLQAVAALSFAALTPVLGMIGLKYYDS